VKVAIDALALLSPTTGLARYTRELVGQLRSLPDIEVHLQYGFRWSRELRESPVPRIAWAKTAFKRAVPQSYEVLRAARQIAFSAVAARRRIDLYHAPTFLPLKFSGPTVITVHDLSFVRYPAAHPAERVRVLNRHLPRAIESSRFVLVDSDFVRSEVLEAYGAPADKVVTTHLGVSERFHPMSELHTRPVLERHGLRHGKYVLSVGTLEPRKNLVGTLEAYGMLPAAIRASHPLAIVGMLGWHMDEMKSRLAALARAGKVVALGYIPEDDLPDLYAGAAAFIYPSIYEGFGLPVLEALASGVPVVTSNRSSLKEVAGDCAATVDPEDYPGLSAALLKALQDHHEAKEADRKRGIEWAKRFTWALCAEKTASIYRRALKLAM
jgi:glycosyltransferase involved in cell wall biosynthesis